MGKHVACYVPADRCFAHGDKGSRCGLTIPWGGISAEHKLHPREEDNKETLVTTIAWVLPPLRPKGPLSPPVLDPHQHLIGSIVSVSHPTTTFAEVHPGVFCVTFLKSNSLFSFLLLAVFPADRTNGSQLFWQLPSRWGQSSWRAVWLGHGLLMHLCTVGLPPTKSMEPSRSLNDKYTFFSPFYFQL